MKKDLVILFLLVLPVISPLFQRGYFPIHDDLQTMRQLQMNYCFHDRQIPCRWIADMGYGYGFPLFNFYPPGPYLIGQIFVNFGISYIDTAKIIGILGFLGAAFIMYFLGREVWNRYGGLVGAILYTYAPYHAVNFYVRAAVNEFWAAVFFPSILLGIYKLIKQPQAKWVIWTALAVAGLMLTHNQMLLIFAPVALAWTVYWWFAQGWLRSLKLLIISVVWGVGLAAFYLLPAILEQKFAHVETLVIGYFNYLAHFVSLRQMFVDINWGYGASVLGTGDGLSFALGYLQWLVPLGVIVLIAFSQKVRQQYALILLLVASTLGSLFMMHSKSTFIWQAFKPLEFLQFPWRFMSLATFCASLLGSTIALGVNRKILAIIIGLTLALNGNYFRPRTWYPDMTDATKFSGHAWYLLTTNGIFDFLPIWAAQPPADGKQEDLVFVKGSGVYNVNDFKTNFQKYQIQASESAVLELQTYYFPGWRVWLDKLEVPIDPTQDPILGRMRVDMSAGNHELVARFMDTPVRFIANSISLIAWSILVLYFVPLWRKK